MKRLPTLVSTLLFLASPLAQAQENTSHRAKEADRDSGMQDPGRSFLLEQQTRESAWRCTRQF